MTEPTENPVAVALVGLGWWGQKIATLMGDAPALALRRAVEPDARTAAAFAAQHSVPVTPDLETALSDPGVEAVVLVTPHALHAEQIAAAAAAGKHVFCEKPLALTGAAAFAAVRDLSARGLVLGIGHERRFDPPVREMLARADAGDFGRLLQIEGQFSHDKLMHLPPDNWRLSAENAPAAGMTATGIHLLDLSVRLMGPARRVLATGGRLASDMPQGDTIAAHVVFEDGGSGHVAANLAMPFVSRLAVYGSKGWMEIRDKAHVEAPEGWVVTDSGKGGPIRTREVPPDTRPVLDNLVAFAAAIRGGAPYPVRGSEIVAATALLEAIGESAVSGAVTTVARFDTGL